MVKLSFDLSRYRLHLRLVKRRKSTFDEPLLPRIEDIKRTRTGNKISRFFRHIFEHKRIKKILGTNLALMIVASSVFSPIAADEIEAEEVFIQTNTITLTTRKGIRYPVERVKINQGYKFFHPAVDFGGNLGDPVYPIMVGAVEVVSYSRFGYGNAVIVDHGDKLTSLYAHLSRILVNEGDVVSINTIIGEIGSTGRSTGNHLHLEVRDHGRPLNPFTILPQQQ